MQSDLNEHQGERLVSTLTIKGYRIETCTCNVVRQTLFEQFATTKTGLQDPNIRTSLTRRISEEEEIYAAGAEDASSSFLTKENTMEQKVTGFKTRARWKKGSWLTRMRQSSGS